MSLIHDALKSMDAPQDSKPAMARASKVAVRGRPAWLDAVLAFAVVLGAGILGWFVWQSQMKPKALPPPMAVAPSPTPAPAPAPVPAPVAVASPVAETAVPAAASPSPVTAAAAEPGAAPVSAMATAPAPVAVPAPAVAVAAPAAAPARSSTPTPAVAVEPAAPKTVVANSPRGEVAPPAAAAVTRSSTTRQARGVNRSNTAAAPAVATAPAVDDAPVELRFARFVAAMKESRTADAERELAALKERLPAGSLGLLRAQAWFDLRAGRDAAAAGGYRAILERLPGDEEAAINLASIQSRQQKTEEARATLDAASRLQPDSAALRAALAQFTPAARQ